MFYRSKAHFNPLVFAELLGYLSCKLATIIRNDSLGHPKAANESLPVECLDSFGSNGCQSLCLHPLGEIIHRHDYMLQLTPRNREWTKQIDTPHSRSEEHTSELQSH